MASLSAISISILFGRLIDLLNSSGSFQRIGAVLGMITGALLLRFFMTWVAQRESWIFGENVLFSDLRAHVVEQTFHVPLTVLERMKRGDILSLITNNVDAVADIVRIGIPEVVVAIFSLIFVSASSIVLDRRLGLILLSCWPIIFLGTMWYIFHSEKAYIRELEAHGEFDDLIADTVDSRESIQIFHEKDAILQRLESAAKTVAKAEGRTLRLQNLWFPLVQVGYYMPIALVTFFGGLMAMDGQIRIGAVVAVAMNAQLIINPMDDLVYWMDQFQLSWAALRRIFGIQGGENPPGSQRGRKEQAGKYLRSESDPMGPGSICSDELKFRYKFGKNAVNGLSVQVKRNSRTALAGLSGSGKTSFALIISGLINEEDEKAGNVWLSGHLTAPKPREVIYLDQINAPFHDSYRFYLTLGCPGTPDSEINRVLNLLGLQSLIGEIDNPMDCSETSPAMLQKLALARLLLQKAQLYIMDEAFAVFPKKEGADLQKLVEEELQGRTILSIAHRQYTIDAADEVLQLNSIFLKPAKA
ncbi:ABC transporter transmembrane domain-containing protein [Parascardovia denticolens]|uniref:ABC transporter transmembrane domain-containing protein n=1 Tax=Parascardovia denticolens TaxID=78258 RepID=UPI00030B9A5F|nr:ABC transporter ATP-binding protein [Parascardovia denticolens]